jgi:FtsP/CotA-like multicopper oxidase with cupredoxin domain
MPARPPNRRQFLAAIALGAAPLAACTRASSTKSGSLNAAIQSTERARPHTGRTRSVTLTPQPRTLDIGGRQVQTWSYGPTVPAQVIRANIGDELAVMVANRLPEPTSVHWHGIALRNDMDGVTPASGNLPAGSDFTYRFSVPDSGSYWFHPHVGVQADYGLYGALIVDDPAAAAAYDLEWIVVLDDWTDGVGPRPRQILSSLRSSGMSGMGSGSMSGMSGGSMSGMSSKVGSSALLGGDAGDVKYPMYLINGRTDPAPDVLRAKPGQRVRLRIINAGADTAFRVGLGGHRLTVTHTDGYPVTPRTVDALLLGMGERYDAILTLGDGVFPLVAQAEGKSASTRALVRTSAGTLPDTAATPAELHRQIGTAALFSATRAVRLPTRTPDTVLTARLGGDMASYVWTINGKTYTDTVPLMVQQGQRVRLNIDNQSMMWHPMHLHGHTFQLVTPAGTGPRKDTTIVLPMQSMSVDFQADNPGTWMLHCHNAYHAEAGMMTRLQYRT